MQTDQFDSGHIQHEKGATEGRLPTRALARWPEHLERSVWFHRCARSDRMRHMQLYVLPSRVLYLTATLSRSHKNSPSRGNLGRCVKDRVDRPEWSHGKHPDSVSLGASGNTVHQGSREEFENMRCTRYEAIVCRGGSSTGRPPTLACLGRFENRASFDGSIMIHAIVSHHVARINWRDASGSRSIDGWNGSSKGSWTGWGRMITERRKDSPWLTSDLELTDSDGRDGEREWDDRGMLN